MNAFSKPLLLALSVALTGCVTTPAIRPLIKKVSSVPVDPSEYFSQTETAHSAFGLLRDQRKFPEEGIAEVKITASSIELIGFSVAETNSSSFGMSHVWGDAFVTSSSKERSKTSVSREQRVIWFADIAGIELQRTTIYVDNKSHGYEKRVDGYFCILKMRSNEVQPFYSPNESDVKKLAAAFAFFSRMPIFSAVVFPSVGIKVSPVDSVIVEMLHSGPFDVAGIPIGSKVVGIGGAKLTPSDMVGALTNLQPGSHEISFIMPGEIYSKTAQIFVPGNPPPIQ